MQLLDVRFERSDSLRVGCALRPQPIVLLSDGAQTSGNIDAATSAERAKTLRIPIYTIALGTDSGVIDIMYPDGEVRPLEVPPDFQAAARVAQTTGGEFFTAVTARELEGMSSRFKKGGMVKKKAGGMIAAKSKGKK